MSIEEENKALVRRVYDLYNRREIETAYKLYSSKCVFHMSHGDLSVKQCWEFDSMLLSAFPDLSLTIEDMVAEGDMVAYRVTLRGTHQGEFMGIASTGNKIDITFADFVRIKVGKLVEFWNAGDNLRLMQQLGVIPKQ
jgi:predicted ester cyclase